MPLLCYWGHKIHLGDAHGPCSRTLRRPLRSYLQEVTWGESARAISGRQRKGTLSLAGSLPARGATDTPAPGTAGLPCSRGFEPGSSGSDARRMTAEPRGLSLCDVPFVVCGRAEGDGAVYCFHTGNFERAQAGAATSARGNSALRG